MCQNWINTFAGCSSFFADQFFISDCEMGQPLKSFNKKPQGEMKMTGALVRDSLKWWLVVVHFSSYSLLIHLVYLQSLDTFPVYSLFSLCLCIYLITMPKISPRPEHIINIEYIKWSVGYFFGALLISPSSSVVVHLANESPPVIMSRVCVIMNDDKGAELTGCSWGWLYGKRDKNHVVLPISSRFGSGPRPRSFCRRRTERDQEFHR